MSTQRLRRAVIALIVGFVAVLAPIVPVAAQSDSSSNEASEAPAPVEAPAPANTALSVWRVYVDGPEDGAWLANSGFDLLEGRGDGYLLVLGENDVAVALRQDGFRVERDRELSPLPGVGRNRIEQHGHQHDQSSGLEAEMSVAQALTYYGGYRTVVEHYAHLDSVVANYPNLATTYDYGDSWLKVQGRSGANDLRVICLTNMQPGDCQLSPTSAKPRATIMAAIHARELQTSEMAWRLIDHLTQGYGVDPDVTHMMDTTEIWIIPVANPDGREIVESGGNSPYLQRKNANDSAGSCTVPPTSSNHYGVDLNRNASTHNYGGVGTTTNPCAQTYRGTGPASEPEQQALEALFRNLWPDQKGAVSSAAPDTTTGTFITIHSSSELILLPPGEGGIAPNDDQLRAYAFRMSHYNGYETGTGPEILYGVTGSTDDWVYYDLGVPSVTYELSPQSGTCGGFTPAYSCIEPLWDLNRDALLYAVKVAETPYITSRGPTTTSASTDGSVEQGTAMTVTAVVDDNAYGTTGFSRPTVQTVTEAEYYLDVPPSQGGTPVAMSAADGSFNQNTETTTASIDTTGLALGDHTVFVRGRNAAGFWGPIQATSFTVTAVVDDPPTADDQSVFTPEDTAVAITLTGSDPEGNALTYAVTGGPSSGSLSGTAPNLTYTPNPGFSGSDSFTFTTNDGALTSAPGTVTISVGVPIGPIFSDDFESNLGWTTNPDGTDTATTGQWEVGNPDQTSSGITLQLGTTTSGSQALVTGAAGGSSAGTWDIDNGDTTVRSPDIALPAGAVLDLSFQYNFAHLNNGSVDDYLRVSVVGSGTTMVLEQTGDGSDRAGAWTSFNADISAFAGQTVYLLVEAADAAGGSLIEAAIDDLVIESLGSSNSAPSADGQSVSLDEDTSLAITLTGSDPDGDALSFSVTGGPSSGSLSGTAPNLTYTPDANFNGSDSFTFVANDGTVDSASATVNITVNPVNDLPTTSPVSATTDENVPVAVTLLGNDVDGDTLTYGISGGPSNGTLSGTAPNLTYTPDAGFVGVDTFDYQASDNGGLTYSAASTVTVTVNNINEAPTADSQSVSLDEDTWLAITLTASDPDGDVLTYSVTGSPTSGTLSGTAPNLTYTPDANFNGSDSFTFVANDGALVSNTATVNITVNAVNDLPTTAPVSATTVENVAVALTLLGDDVDGDSLTYGISGGPSNGTLTGTAPNLTYTPDPGFTGVDTFDYQASDNGGLTYSAASTVTITVNNVNDAPTAASQSVSLDEDTSLAITLTAADPDGDPLTFSVTSGPSDGTLTGTAPNLTYTPDANFNGSDSFTFVANDGEFDSNLATVLITVNPVNDLPTTQPVSATTDEDVAVAITLLGDDVDGDTLTYGISGGPSNGTLTGTAPNLTYTPDAGFVGVDSFDYQASDNGGSTYSAASTVTITVNNVNDAPTADSQSVSLDEDTSLAITLTGSDPDGDALSFSVTGGPSSGSLSGTAPNLTYTPDANFNGSDSFTFVANDGEFDSAPATVSITVNPVNDIPTTTGISVVTDEGVPVSITLLGNDVDGDTLTYGVSGGPSNGTLTGTAPNLTYTPDPGFVGVDSFDYQASDNGGLTWSQASTVMIAVNEVAGGLPFNDDFEAGSTNWTSLINGGGTWSLISSGGSQWFEGSVSGRNDVSAQVAGDSAWSDYAFEAQVLTSNVVRRGDGPALLARVQDANNHYRFRFENRRWIIEEVVGGSVTKLAQSSRTNLGSGTNTIRVEVLGTSLQMFVNGSLVVSTTDSTFSSGQIGIGVHGATAQFDNVAVTALP